MTKRDPTLEALDRALAAAHAAADTRSARGAYLGGSEIGEQCLRALWLNFRQAMPRAYSVDSIRAISDGHRGEALMADRLRMVPGVILVTQDDDGQQVRFSAFGGHFKAHLDGVITGLKPEPGIAYVWEHKQCNEKKFAALGKTRATYGESDALEKWDAIYYAQAQVYMELSGIERHYLTVATPGGRDYDSVVTKHNPAVAASLMEKARLVINASEPPEKITEDGSFFRCQMCRNHTLCHGTALMPGDKTLPILPRKTCLTCIYSTPERDGTWTCANARVAGGKNHGDQKKVLEPDFTVKDGACPNQLLIPPMLRWTAKDAGPGRIEYADETGETVFVDGEGTHD